MRQNSKSNISLTIIDDLLDAPFVVDQVFALFPLLLSVSSQDGLRPNVWGLASGAEKETVKQEDYFSLAICKTGLPNQGGAI